MKSFHTYCKVQIFSTVFHTTKQNNQNQNFTTSKGHKDWSNNHIGKRNFSSWRSHIKELTGKCNDGKNSERYKDTQLSTKTQKVRALVFSSIPVGAENRTHRWNQNRKIRGQRYGTGDDPYTHSTWRSPPMNGMCGADTTRHCLWSKTLLLQSRGMMGGLVGRDSAG